MTTFHPEDRARARIDEKLQAAGWLVQSRAEMNLGAGPGVAVREQPTASGPVDYGLFVGRRLCGVVEAKPDGTTLSGFSEQAARYIADAPEKLVREAGQVRFEYVASPSETLFRDHADPDPASRRVYSVHRPETLERWVRQGETIRMRLRAMPPLIADGLRQCQVEAIGELEASLAAGQPRALVQMTMGAGKTFTAATLAHRLLAHAGFRRILFLADRANLVRQARTEFLAYRPPGTGRSFPELYNVQALGRAGVDDGAQVVVSTIQRVYAALMGTEVDETEEEISEFERPERAERLVSYNPAMPIETFDLIVTDECHRSIYGTWRQVLEYFDAFIVGLTATPSRHTLGYFNRNLVAKYPYELSVIDGVNVDFEVFRIRTEIGERGATVSAGFDLPVRDRRTRAQRYETLTEDFTYTAPELDRTVVSPNQIRTVIEQYRDTLFTELFPGRTEVPKTLIFAKDDNQAEEIVGIVRAVFGRGNDFAMKITYRAADNPETLIKRFQEDYNPRIAVTVDMIATGTDVKALEALIFLRDVKSKLYFEQMKGRGVRTVAPDKLRTVTPDAEAKTRFVLVDAVGVTESAKAVSQPVERRRTVSFEGLLDDVAAGVRDDDTLSALAGRLSRLDGKLAEGARERIAEAAGGRSLHDIAGALFEAVDPDGAHAGAEDPEVARAAAKETAAQVFDDPALRRLIVEVKTRTEIRIDTVSPDAVISSGWDETKARDHVERFQRFVEEERDALVALQILYNRPYAQRRLTVEAVEDLREAMRRPPWLLEPVDVWRAYKRLDADRARGNPAGTLADVVMLVRYALGQAETLDPLPSVVAGRFNLWLGREERAGRRYTDEQRAWLMAIRDHLAVNAAVTPADLHEAPSFTDRGGVVAARRLFGDHLPDLLDDLAETLVA